MLTRCMVTLLITLAVSSDGRADRAARLDSARALAQEAMAGLAPDARRLVVRWSPGRPAPSVVRGMRLAVEGKTATQRARSFLRLHPGLVVHGSELRKSSVRRSKGRTVVRFEQTYRGLPVLDATATVAMDPGGRVRSLHSSVRIIDTPTVVPVVDGPRAVRVAAMTVTGKPVAGGSATLALSPRDGGVLVQVVVLPMTADPLGRRHLVDAATGKYLGWLPGVRIHGEVLR